MASKAERDRKERKAVAVAKRLDEIHEQRELLIGMLDEYRLDLIILALGIGAVNLTLEDDDAA